MGILKTARSDPTHDDAEGDIDVYERTVETDEDGNARTLVRYERAFTEEPKLLVSSSAGVVEWTGRGQSQVMVSVRGGPDDGEAVVTVLAIGSRR